MLVVLYFALANTIALMWIYVGGAMCLEKQDDIDKYMSAFALLGLANRCPLNK